MPQEYNVVIADTTCLILLHKINELTLLQRIFKQITTTTEIVNEFGIPLPHWINIKSPKNKAYQSILELEVAQGEASAMALAIESKNLS